MSGFYICHGFRDFRRHVKRFAQIVEADVPCENAAEIFGVEFLFQFETEDSAGVGGVDLYAGEVGAEAAVFPDGFSGDFGVGKGCLFFQELEVGEQFCANADSLFFQCDMHFF